MLRKLFSLLPCIFIVACGSLLSPVEQRPVSNYEISDSSISGGIVCPKSVVLSNVLFISPMLADLPYNNNKMYYSQKTNELDAFGYGQWVVSPTALLTQVMTKKILKSCVYRGVVTSDALANANYRLVTKLVSLRQNVDARGDGAEVVMVVYAELIDLDRNQVVDTNAFIEKITTKAGPQAMADGVSQLMTKFDNELIKWLKQNTH